MRTFCAFRTHTVFVRAVFFLLFFTISSLAPHSRCRLLTGNGSSHTQFTLYIMFYYMCAQCGAMRPQIYTRFSFGGSVFAVLRRARAHTHSLKTHFVFFSTWIRLSVCVWVSCSSSLRRRRRKVNGYETNETRGEFIYWTRVHNLLPHCSRSQANKRHTNVSYSKEGKKAITTPHRLQRSQLAATQSYLPTAAADLLLCVIFFLYSLFCFSIFLCASDLYMCDCECCTTYVSLLSLLFRHSSISSRLRAHINAINSICDRRRAREERRNMIIFDLFLFCATSPPSSFAVVHLSFCETETPHTY